MFISSAWNNSTILEGHCLSFNDISCYVFKDYITDFKEKYWFCFGQDWEISVDKIYIGERIGSGSFGTVYKVEYFDTFYFSEFFICFVCFNKITNVIWECFNDSNCFVLLYKYFFLFFPKFQKNSPKIEWDRTKNLS